MEAFWQHKELLRGNLKLATKKRLLDRYVFSVLKYGCENWTQNKTLTKRIDAFEQWCFRRVLKISWKDRVSNEQVLYRIEEEKLHFRKILWNINWHMLDIWWLDPVVLMSYWFWSRSLMGRKQEADLEGRGQMTLYNGWRTSSLPAKLTQYALILRNMYTEMAIRVCRRMAPPRLQCNWILISI